LANTARGNRMATFAAEYAPSGMTSSAFWFYGRLTPRPQPGSMFKSSKSIEASASRSFMTASPSGSPGSTSNPQRAQHRRRPCRPNVGPRRRSRRTTARLGVPPVCRPAELVIDAAAPRLARSRPRDRIGGAEALS